MEGKNCFRTQWTHEPIYSGGGFAPLLLPGDAALKTKASSSCLAMACGNILNVVDAATGEVRCSFTTPMDDVILCLDTVTLLETGAGTVSSHTEDSALLPPAPKRAKKESSSHSLDSSPSHLDQDKEEQEGDAYVPAGSYVALGTRALQIYVLRMDAVATEQVSVVEEDAEKGNEESSTSGATQHVVEYTFTVVKQWTAAQQAISCLCFSSRGHFLAAGSTDGSIKLWNVFHHHLTHNFRCPHASHIRSFYLSDNEKYLVAGTFEGYISVFDLESKHLVGNARPHVQSVEAIVFRVADGMLFSFATDRKMAVLQLDASKKVLEERRSIVVKEHVSTAEFEGDTLLHTGSQSGVVCTYNISADGSLSKAAQLRHQASGIGAEAGPSTEESNILCIRSSRLIKGCAGSWKQDTSCGPSILFVSDGGCNIHVLAMEKEDAGALTKKSTEYTVQHSLVGFLDQVLEIKFLPENFPYQRLVINNSKSVRLYDGNGCLSSKCLQGHSDIVMSAAVSLDGQLIATGGKDMSIRFWSTRTWETVAIGERGHSAEITGLRFNAKQASDYLLLFSISADENLRLWDAGKHVLPCLNQTKLKGGNAGEDDILRFQSKGGVNAAHAGPVFTVEVAPNDQYVATGGKDKIVNLWTIQGKKIYKEGVLRGHRRGITSLAFSTVDRVLASSSNDGSVRLWSLTSLTCLKTLQADRVAVLQVALFNGSTQAVTSNAEGVVRVWAISASEAVWTGEIHDEKIWALAVQEKGDRTTVLTGAADGVIIATEEYTAEEVKRVREERADIIHKEQELTNQIRKGQFKEAFLLALRLDHPRHLRQVVERWTSKGIKECEEQLQNDIFPSLEEQQIIRLLQFVREWLTSSRYCAVAVVILRSFLASQQFDQVSHINAIRLLIEPLLAYVRRHSQRLHGTLHKTYYVDYITRDLSPQTLSTVPSYVALRSP